MGNTASTPSGGCLGACMADDEHEYSAQGSGRGADSRPAMYTTSATYQIGDLDTVHGFPARLETRGKGNSPSASRPAPKMPSLVPVDSLCLSPFDVDLESLSSTSSASPYEMSREMQDLSCADGEVCTPAAHAPDSVALRHVQDSASERFLHPLKLAEIPDSSPGSQCDESESPPDSPCEATTPATVRYAAVMTSKPERQTLDAAHLDLNTWLLQTGEVEFNTDPVTGQRELLGGGSVTQVYRGVWNGLHDVAIKLPTKKDVLVPRNLVREVATLSKLNNSRIVTFYGMVQLEGQLAVVLEYMPGGSLQAALQDGLRWPNGGRAVAIAIAEGLVYLHSRNVIHLNVKPSNVLLGKSADEVKLSDVGTAAVVPKDVSGVYDIYGAGSQGVYTAPEVLNSNKVRPSADVYSLGMILLNIGGAPPPTQHGEPLQLPRLCPPAVARLALRCVMPQPEHRPTVHEVLDVLVQSTE